MIFGEDYSLSDTVQIWGTIISAIIMAATVAQVIVAYMISHTVRKYSVQSDVRNSSTRINSQWQEFNKLVIIDATFRDTLVRMENITENDQDLKIRYMMFYTLNILHDSYHSQKFLGVKADHLDRNLRDMIRVLTFRKDIAISILRGNRGYDDDFAEYCISHLST